MARRQADYKRPGPNDSVVLKRYLGRLAQAASFFDQYFRNKAVTYVTAEETISLYFSATNFMHLCGIDYQKGAASFFDDCLAGHLVINEMMIKKDGTTFQKLQVLASINELIGSYVNLTLSGRYLYLEFDYALRTKKQILALTLKETPAKLVPQSLLDLKRQKTFPKGIPVTAIYAKDLASGQEEVYYRREERAEAVNKF